MKYSVLASIAHNFTHSFVSDMNVDDEGLLRPELWQLARKARSKRISIHWLPASRQQMRLPARVLGSIARYKARLPQHCHDAGASIESILEFRTDIFLQKNGQIAIEAHLLDDRGVEHACSVVPA